MVAGHAGEILAEHLAVHVHTFLPDVHVAAHFRENALSACNMAE